MVLTLSKLVWCHLADLSDPPAWARPQRRLIPSDRDTHS